MARLLTALLLMVLALRPLAAEVRVTAAHPNRLMVDAPRLAAIQSKVGTQEWADFMAYVDANRGNRYTGWADAIAHLTLATALACRVTGDTSYCTDAVGQLQAARTGGARSAWFTAAFDIAGNWVTNPIGIYPDASMAVLVGDDYPITFWSHSGTGVLPSPLVMGTPYWIHLDHLTPNVASYWRISATKGGPPLTLSGSYSGEIFAELPWRFTMNSNGARTFLRAWAVAYDWLYPYLTAGQKADWYNQLSAAAQIVSKLDYNTGGKILNNVWVGDHGGGLMAAIAVLGDNPADTANLQAILNTLDADFRAELAANGSLLTGGFIEGTEYTPEQMFCLWDVWDAIYTASSRADNRFTGLQSYYQGAVDYYMHAFHTGGFSANGNSYTDLQAHGEILQSGLWNARMDGGKVLPPSAGNRVSLLDLLETMKILGDNTRAGYVKKMLDDYAPKSRLKDVESAYNAQYYIHDIIRQDPNITPQTWESAPLVKWFGGTNDIFMKSGWDANATNVNIFGALTQSATSAIDHIRSEAGAFSFYRKGTTLTGNWTAYPYDTSNTLNYNLSRYPGSGIWPSVYSMFLPAGVTTWNNIVSGASPGQAVLERMETKTGYTYGRFDLTNTFRHAWGVVPPAAWGNANYLVSGASREWMYLAPDILVIHDKIRKTQAVPASQWNLQGQAHTVTLPGANLVKIDTGTQSLNATVLLPAAPQMVVKRSDRPYVLWVDRSATPTLVLEAMLAFGYGVTSTTVTLSGATGPWSVLNGTWTATVVDGRNLRINAGQVNTSAIATEFGGQAVVLDGHGSVAPYNALTAAFDGAVALSGGRYVEVMGQAATSENFFVVLEGVDSDAAPGKVTRLTGTNVNVAQVGDGLVVGFVPDDGPQLPISYAYTDGGEHKIAGLDANTVYRVDKSTAGLVVINAGGVGSGVDMTSTAAGVLVFTAGQGNVTTPELHVAPETLTFECQVNGDDPDGQAVALSLARGKLSSWTAGAAQPWLTVMPGSGTAAGVLNVNVGCSGLPAGVYEDTITLQSLPVAALSSTLRVGVRLRVNPESAMTGAVGLKGRVQLR